MSWPCQAWTWTTWSRNEHTNHDAATPPTMTSELVQWCDLQPYAPSYIQTYSLPQPHLQSSENYIVGVGGRGGGINQSQCSILCLPIGCFFCFCFQHQKPSFHRVVSDRVIKTILNCRFPELVAPCTVICRTKTPHFCKDTKACHARKLAPLLQHVINRHVTNMWACEPSMWGRLCAGFFFLFSRRGFAIYCSQRRNLMDLSAFCGGILRLHNFFYSTVLSSVLLYVHEHNSVSTWSNIVWNLWKSTLKARSIRVRLNQGTAEM